MSFAELIVILFVALIVFGPNKLPMLAGHLGRLYQKYHQVKTQISAFWQAQINEAQLLENELKAREGDKAYSQHTEKNKGPDEAP